MADGTAVGGEEIRWAENVNIQQAQKATASITPSLHHSPRAVLLVKVKKPAHPVKAYPCGANNYQTLLDQGQNHLARRLSFATCRE